jgi:hypothetical protein
MMITNNKPGTANSMRTSKERYSLFGAETPTIVKRT